MFLVVYISIYIYRERYTTMYNCTIWMNNLGIGDLKMLWSCIYIPCWVHVFHSYLLQLFSFVCTIFLWLTNILMQPFLPSQSSESSQSSIHYFHHFMYSFASFFAFFPISNVMSNSKLGDPAFQKSLYKMQSIYYICRLFPIKKNAVSL